MQPWRIIPYRKSDAFENMAVDEAVFLENQKTGSRPTLRFYGWDPPAVSLGFFQDYNEGANEEFCRTNRIDIVRRLTGGKAVLHDREITYSLVAGQDNPLFPNGILGTYLTISRCLVHAFSEIGIRADMEPSRRRAAGDGLNSFCFSMPSQYELLVEGRKICGSAQVRSNGSFLQHGSILLEFDPVRTCRAISSSGRTDHLLHMTHSVTSVCDHVPVRPNAAEFCSILKAAFEICLGVKLEEGRLTPEEERRKEKLLTEKYRNDSWNRMPSGRFRCFEA